MVGEDKELGGKDGPLAPLLKDLLDAALGGQTQAHVEEHRPNRPVRRCRSFSSKTALLKVLYLGSQRVMETWTMPVINWSLTISQLAILYGERVRP